MLIRVCLLDALNIRLLNVIIFKIVLSHLLSTSLSMLGLSLLHIVIALSAGRSRTCLSGRKKRGFWAGLQVTFCRDLLCYLEMGANQGCFFHASSPWGRHHCVVGGRGFWLFLLFASWRLLDAILGDCTCKGLLRKWDIPFKHVITWTFTSYCWDCGLSKLLKP